MGKKSCFQKQSRYFILKNYLFIYSPLLFILIRVTEYVFVLYEHDFMEMLAVVVGSGIIPFFEKKMFLVT